ncbi:MvdC/MvdD family ATP grasp protein [Nocardia stercoris]|uniref:ATP-grasp domain-containing protein n=1 Tax=Nocardia stercoris TaxID=2483361 RepID=A0A3M2KYY9_9NOCA|nr:hypothetical protein [Nocardia stercoris]RMI30334.1 hypothetical protein EBN03_22055 [Nocardia stercoris]
MPQRQPGSVLIVTETGDLHADAVAAVMRDRHGIDPIRLDMRDFPTESGTFRIGASRSERTLSHVLGLDGVGAVWWRRPHRCRVPTGIRSADNEFRQAECDGFLQGLLWSMPAVWVNDPGADRTATRKLVQLEAAVHAGLRIPETLVTNDPEEARRFVKSRSGAVIYKRTGTGRAEFSETRVVSEPDLDRLDTIRSTPTTFQDYIEAACDLRVVWIDGTEWTVRIDSQSGAGRVDSRLDTTVDFAPDRLPAAVSRSLSTLMGTLGLAFGVVDIRLGADGEHYFLEVNPQGQFAYLEIKTGLPIVASLANFLVCGDATV